MSQVRLRPLAEADLVERADHIDVVRLLAYAQDLASILGDADQDDW